MDITYTIEYQELEAENDALREALKAWQSVHGVVTSAFSALIHQGEYREWSEEYWPKVNTAILMMNNVLSETEEE